MRDNKTLLVAVPVEGAESGAASSSWHFFALCSILVFFLRRCRL